MGLADSYGLRQKLQSKTATAASPEQEARVKEIIQSFFKDKGYAMGGEVEAEAVPEASDELMAGAEEAPPELDDGANDSDAKKKMILESILSSMK